MFSLSTLHLGLLIAAIYTVVVLAIMLITTASIKRKPLFAKANGSEWEGVKYAFTAGMLPSAKESVRMHLPTFVGGMLYHAGIFVAALHLVAAVIKFPLPPAVVLAVRIVMLSGLVAGAALLVKRAMLARMRIISSPDDYIANLLADMFLVLSIATTMTATVEPWLTVCAIVLLLYIPVGKIRHCVFFFYTRLNFGRLFGRRGVLPHQAVGVKAGSR
jgi:nitrate reductase gamma subunit